MSWDGYLDSLQGYAGGPAHCERGAILGLDGSLWTSTNTAKGLRVSAAEAQQIARVFKSKDFTQMQAGGIMCEGQKFQFLREDQDDGFPYVCGKKKGAGSITIQATKSAIVVGLCPESGQQGNLNKGVSQISKYLVSTGY